MGERFLHALLLEEKINTSDPGGQVGGSGRVSTHLHILDRAGLGHTEHVEELQDQLLHMLESVLLSRQVWVDLLLHLRGGGRKQVSGGHRRREGDV